MIIAIDGPAGSGKSTTARAVARRLGLLYLDTGAMYRAVALAFLEAGLPVTEASASRLLPTLDLNVVDDEGTMRVTMRGEDVSDRIRAPDVGQMASRVATLASVREAMVDLQRRIGRASSDRRGVVVDGRDIGTVVFPDATLKIFMEADLEVRAERRLRELTQRGHPVDRERVLQEMERRDRQDEERALAPLRKAQDAVTLDTSTLSFDDQVSRVVRLARERAEKK